MAHKKVKIAAGVTGELVGAARGIGHGQAPMAEEGRGRIEREREPAYSRPCHASNIRAYHGSCRPKTLIQSRSARYAAHERGRAFFASLAL